MSQGPTHGRPTNNLPGSRARDEGTSGLETLRQQKTPNSEETRKPLIRKSRRCWQLFNIEGGCKDGKGPTCLRVRKVPKGSPWPLSTESAWLHNKEPKQALAPVPFCLKIKSQLRKTNSPSTLERGGERTPQSNTSKRHVWKPIATYHTSCWNAKSFPPKLITWQDVHTQKLQFSTVLNAQPSAIRKNKTHEDCKKKCMFRWHDCLYIKH